MKPVGLFAISVLLIVAVTLPLGDLSLQNKPDGFSFLLLDSSKFSDLDIALNILLFVPFGFALGQLLKLRRFYRLIAVMFVGFALSHLIEFLQAFTATRMSSVFDV